MKKITFEEFSKRMREHNKSAEASTPIFGYVVFKNSCFTKTTHSIEERTYKVSSDNKHFKDDALSFSIFGKCEVDGDVQKFYSGECVEYCLI